MDNAKPWANRRLARPGLVRRLEVALGWLWGGFGVALVEPWWSLGGALVEPWCGFGVALVWPWCGFVLRSLCLVYGLVVALWWPCGGLEMALGGFARHFCPLPSLSGSLRKITAAPGGPALPAPDARRSAFPPPPLFRDRESWLRAGRGQRINDASGKCKHSQNR